MRISRIFGLEASQGELDFVDIDVETDMPLFLDPYFLSTGQDHWSIDATLTLRSFFQTFVDLLVSGQETKARKLFNHLHEPNETCLGLSKGAPKGNAIGDTNADLLFESILQSKAVVTGLVEDLEDVRFFIAGIDKDRVSDITTNVIRGHLVEYTKNQCELWNIPLRVNVPTGFMWNRSSRDWENRYDDMLVVDERKILLVPKHAVSFVKRHTPEQYFRHFVLTFLQHEHLRLSTPLVEYRKDGTPFVTKKRLQEEVAPYSKEFLANFTENHPIVFEQFRDWVAKNSTPISNKELVEEDPIVLARYLKSKLASLAPGSADAEKYHRLMIGILEFLMYPSLTSPVKEKEVHQGRKRIDICFDNSATVGFFKRSIDAHGVFAPYVVVECKNYAKDVKNPEMDQLIGRFSDKRGRLGILACRSVDDLETLYQRCNDAWSDGNGLVLPLTDSDIVAMLDKVESGVGNPCDQILRDIARKVVVR